MLLFIIHSKPSINHTRYSTPIHFLPLSSTAHLTSFSIDSHYLQIFSSQALQHLQNIFSSLQFIVANSERRWFWLIIFFSFILHLFSCAAISWTVLFHRRPFRESFFSISLAQSFAFLFWSYRPSFPLFTIFSCVPSSVLENVRVLLYFGASIYLYRVRECLFSFTFLYLCFCADHVLSYYDKFRYICLYSYFYPDPFISCLAFLDVYPCAYLGV